MVCPDTIGKRKTVTTRQKCTDGPDEEDSRTAEVVSFDMMECKRSECGAWHNGRCEYKGASND